VETWSGGARIRLGNYEPLLQLASGGMATVYLARQAGAAGFQRLVVLKRVHRRLLKDREFYGMFVDEARVASLIRHPNVVPVIDVVEADGELFLVLDYVESAPLSGLLAAAAAEGELLPPAVVARIVADVLAGLHAAHEAMDMQGRKLDVVHRDLSPQNVIVGVDGTSRLIDFGIAKAARRLTVTSAGVLKGKFGYMAPEQTKQLPLDRRADVFSAGIVLYEGLTGHRLFDGDEGDIVLSTLLAEIPDPSTLVPGLPEKLDAVVQTALARDREERFQTASAFLVALETALPPAPPREAAECVARYAGKLLERRRDELRVALEQRSESPAPPSEASPSGPRKSGVAVTLDDQSFSSGAAAPPSGAAARAPDSSGVARAPESSGAVAHALVQPVKASPTAIDAAPGNESAAGPPRGFAVRAALMGLAAIGVGAAVTLAIVTYGQASSTPPPEPSGTSIGAAASSPGATATSATTTPASSATLPVSATAAALSASAAAPRAPEPAVDPRGTTRPLGALPQGSGRDAGAPRPVSSDLQANPYRAR
jgi:serine/threonine-protein kinase